MCNPCNLHPAGYNGTNGSQAVTKPVPVILCFCYHLMLFKGIQHPKNTALPIIRHGHHISQAKLFMVTEQLN